MKVGNSSMATILEVKDVTGGYNKKNPTIQQINFEVKEGEIVALIGLNGAGKSTTIKHILGLMKPMSGRITIYGKTIDEDLHFYRSSYAYIPETPIYYKEMTFKEHLELTALVYGIPFDEMEERAKLLMQKYNMEKTSDRFPDHFSKGMRQKMMIIMAQLIQPPLYIIDEPLMGLDPLGIRTLLETFAEERNRGAGILMSTHILSTAERYCDRFIIIHQGKIIAQGNLQQLQQLSNHPNASLDELYVQFIEGKVSLNGTHLV